MLIGLIVGILIGSVGVGGILLAPLLVYLVGIDLHLAIATSVWSFLFTGVMGTMSYAHKGTISWRMVGWLSMGIIPATILGARTNIVLSTTTLTLILGSLIIFSGINALSQRRGGGPTQSRLAQQWLIVIGATVGFGSALMGAGGAVFLVPILLSLHIPALVAIGVSQVGQLPIAIFATIGFWLYGEIDLTLGTQLGVIQAIGVLIGAQIAHHIPAIKLRQVVAVALIGAGLFMIGRVLV